MDLERRIERLESQNRRLKYLFAAAALGGLSLAVMGAQKDVPTKIEAKAFVLLDDQGKERASLRVVQRKFGNVQHRGPSLVLSDSAGTERVELSCIEGNNGTNQVELELRDKDGKLQVDASGMSEANFQSSITVIHRDGPAANLFALPRQSQLALGAEKGLGSDRVNLFADSESRGLNIFDVKPLGGGGGQEIPEIRILHKGDSNSITIFDKDGKPSWTQPKP